MSETSAGKPQPKPIPLNIYKHRISPFDALSLSSHTARSASVSQAPKCQGLLSWRVPAKWEEPKPVQARQRSRRPPCRKAQPLCRSRCLRAGLGPQRFHGRVVILVNEHTASAGEMLAAFTEENNLATIVGVKTAGRLLSGSTFRAGQGYIVGLPVAAYLTWEGRLIEGKGVSPTVRVELSPERLLAGEDPQMQKALEVANERM